MKVAFYTLGCKVNSYETEAIWLLFKEIGYKKVDFKENADVYIINTCTVTNQADSKSRKVIRQAVKRNPQAVIVVMGCYSQMDPDAVDSIDGVDVIIGTKDRRKIIEHVEKVQKKKTKVKIISNSKEISTFENLHVSSYSEKTRAFLKIQDGCNNFCTYCIIPYARGNVRSKDKDIVLNEARELVKNGYNEIILTGIHTGGYGLDFKDYSLKDLLIDLHKIKNLKRVRISSIEINELTNDVISVIKDSNIIASHLHIPLQSGSDGVLKRMNRKYNKDEYKKRIEYIRKQLPGISITTDVIVGFPGESNEEFKEAYEFIKEIAFSELHVFPYSKRSGTPAAKIKEQINGIIKTNRVNELIALNEILAKNYTNKFKNKVLEVIPEKFIDGYLTGHASNYLKVKFKGDEKLIGNIVNVLIKQPSYPINLGVIE